MKLDWRLHIDISTEAYHEARRAREKAIRDIYPKERWNELLSPLAELVIERAGGQPASLPDAPAGLDAALKDAWSALANALCSEDWISPEQSEHGAALAWLLGDVMAQKIAICWPLWERSLELLSRASLAAHAFIDEIDPEIIRAHRDDLAQLPPHRNPLELMSTFGALHEPERWDAYLEKLKHLEQGSDDTWSFIRQATRYEDEFTMREPLEARSQLLQRLGAKPWIAWLATLPLPLMIAVALRQARNLDEAAELVSSCGDAALSPEDKRRMLVLTAQHELELWIQVQRGLEFASGTRHLVTIDERRERHEEITKELDRWQATELRDRAANLARALVRGGGAEGQLVAAVALGHLFVSGADKNHRLAEHTVVPIVRLALIREIMETDQAIQGSIDELLRRPSASSIVSASRLYFELDGAPVELRSALRLRVQDAYRAWLQSERFLWPALLADDDGELAWTMAGVFSKGEDTLDRLVQALQAVEQPGEGWGYNTDRFFESIPRVCHVLLVGSMASEWLMKQERPDEARQVFDLVWACLHALARQEVRWVGEGPIHATLVHTWARLPVVHATDFETMAASAASRLDTIDWLIACGVNLRHNISSKGSPPRLAVPVQSAIRTRFDAIFGAWRLHAHVEPALAERFAREIGELTPDCVELPTTRSGATSDDPFAEASR